MILQLSAEIYRSQKLNHELVHGLITCSLHPSAEGEREGVDINEIWLGRSVTCICT